MSKQIQLPDLADGETYAGIALNDDGTPSHHLILLPGDSDDANWSKQVAWAASIGGELPTRQEQSLLFANCKNHFKRDWYWSGEEHSDNNDYAWCQSFHDGIQILYRKDDSGFRARAVRRLVIE